MIELCICGDKIQRSVGGARRLGAPIPAHQDTLTEIACAPVQGGHKNRSAAIEQSGFNDREVGRLVTLLRRPHHDSVAPVRMVSDDVPKRFWKCFPDLKWNGTRARFQQLLKIDKLSVLIPARLHNLLGRRGFGITQKSVRQDGEPEAAQRSAGAAHDRLREFKSRLPSLLRACNEEQILDHGRLARASNATYTMWSKERSY